MSTEIKVITVADLQKHIQALMDKGYSDLPVVVSDSRAFYPVQVFEVDSESGYKKALLLRARPDARFSVETPHSRWVCPPTVELWNDEAERIKASCGAFA